MTGFLNKTNASNPKREAQDVDCLCCAVGILGKQNE